MNEQAIAELIASIPGATVEISEDAIKITNAPGLSSLSSPQKKTRGKRKAKKLPKTITSEQFVQLVGVINPDKDYPTGKGRRNVTDLRNRVILETLYRAGLRIQELCDLAPADVNLKKGILYVQEGKNDRDRKIPFGEELQCWFKRWIEVRPQGAEYLFCTARGGQLDTRQVRAMVERVSNKSGVFIQSGKKQKPVWPHALRHTCATNWLDQGLNIREVQELLGHEVVSTTMRYTHVSMKDLDKKIKALG